MLASNSYETIHGHALCKVPPLGPIPYPQPKAHHYCLMATSTSSITHYPAIQNLLTEKTHSTAWCCDQKIV